MRTELHSNSYMTGTDASIGNRGLARPEQRTSSMFSESLTAAAGRLAEDKNAASTNPISCMIRTVPLEAVGDLENETTRASSHQTRRQTEDSTGAIETPFGKVDRTTPGAPSGVSEPILDEERVYFITHQPGEWMHDQRSREAFAKLYGEKALVTLDWLGTVPENNDPMWQTHQPVDANGFPIPQKINLGGTT